MAVEHKVKILQVRFWNFQITDPKDIPSVLAKAFYIAKSGRPGPVLIDITKDAQFGELEFNYKRCDNVRSYIASPGIEKEKIVQAAELINNAKKPYVLFGQGILLADAKVEFENFINKSGIPPLGFISSII